MMRSIARRLLLIIPVLFLANFLSMAYAHYALPRAIANDPFNTQPDPKAAPFIPVYAEYLENVIKGDLGRMPGGVGELLDALKEATKASLGLLVTTLVISSVFGVLLGMQSAKHEPPRIARWLTWVSTVGLAMPTFYIGTLFIVALIIYTIQNESAAQPPLPLQGFGWDIHMVLPVIVLVARPTMEIAQLTANSMVNELSKQYIVAARAQGNTWRSVRWRHVFRNILTPITITISRSFRLLVGELILVEYLFNWPGLGRLVARSLVPSRLTGNFGSEFLNAPLVAGVITLFTLIFLLTDFLAFVLLEIFDPRIRAAEEAAHG